MRIPFLPLNVDMYVVVEEYDDEISVPTPFFADIFSALKGDKHWNALGNCFVGKMIYLL